MNVLLPKYEEPPPWIPPSERAGSPNYDNRITQFMPRLIYIKKSHPDEPLGFNLRGGLLQFSNIFVSKVYAGTLAYKNGLNEADQLISVNGVDFRTISHNEAVKLFKEFSEFLIVAKYSPYEE
ncbi:PDZ domain-containing 11 [Brachionus plicatilis]|uniref:PDZ domain-containing 11 n=1 Tax=Brachionus plicatilis TaxID=10195 RepID=A0A3M7PTY4_BRAPC|nr:PDZ domain-containing 11 [Brachionus plicatilis]